LVLKTCRRGLRQLLGKEKTETKKKNYRKTSTCWYANAHLPDKSSRTRLTRRRVANNSKASDQKPAEMYGPSKHSIRMKERSVA
jgi:hypothetical protein